MKATGIIRRIDDLGRIVIPKEIRKNLRIKNGENLEIFVGENDQIILRKFSQLDKLLDVSQSLIDAISHTTKYQVLISNNDICISASAKKKQYIDKPLSETILNILNDRKNIIKNEPIEITNNESENHLAISPIVAHGDVLGSIIIIADEDISVSDLNNINIISAFLSKYIEE